jgi:Ser/Thr protein kinase RdoA (MazF antagonist)
VDSEGTAGHDHPVELSAAFVAEHWRLRDVSVTPFQIGRFRRGVFTVTSREGVYAAKVNDDPPDVQVSTNELDVFTYLSQRDYLHVPELIPTRRGDALMHTGGRSVVLMEHIPQRFDPDARLSPTSWADLARALALLNAFDDYPHPWGKAFIEHVPEELRAKVRNQPIEAQFLELLDRVVPLRESPRVSLVHAEVNPANSGRRSDGTVVLLDWDGVGSGPTALDYGYPLITQFVDQYDLTVDRDAAEAFYGAYADAGGILDTGEAFLAGLFQAMFLMWFFNTEGRWRRIQWAVAHEEEMCSMIDAARGR